MSKCSIEDCNAPIKYKGMCGKHYKRQWRHGNPNIALINFGPKDNCRVDDCERLVRYPSSGLCNVHHTLFSRHGRLFQIRNAAGIGTINSAGYRVLTVDGKSVYEHRLNAEKKLGRKLTCDEVVHHGERGLMDNSPGNLEVLPSQSEHMKLHWRKWKGEE